MMVGEVEVVVAAAEGWGRWFQIFFSLRHLSPPPATLFFPHHFRGYPTSASPVRLWCGHALRKEAQPRSPVVWSRAEERGGDGWGGGGGSGLLCCGLAEADLPPPSTPVCCSLLCRGETTFTLTVCPWDKKTRSEIAVNVVVPIKLLGKLTECVVSATSPTIPASTSSPPPLLPHAR